MPLPQSLVALSGGGRPNTNPAAAAAALAALDPTLNGTGLLDESGGTDPAYMYDPEHMAMKRAQFEDQARANATIDRMRGDDARRLAGDQDYQDRERLSDAALSDTVAGNHVEAMAGAAMGPNSTALRRATQSDALERILHQYENPAQTRADEQAATQALRDEALRYASDNKLTGALANADARHKSDAELGTKLLEEMIQAGHADPRNPGKRIPLSDAEVAGYRAQFAGGAGGDYTPVDEDHRAVIESALSAALSSKAFPDRASALASLRQHRPDLFK
jgi:hypothetical protein